MQMNHSTTPLMSMWLLPGALAELQLHTCLDRYGRGWFDSWALDVRGFCDIAATAACCFIGCCEGGLVLDKPVEEWTAVEGKGNLAWVSEHLLVDFPVCVSKAPFLYVFLWVEQLFGWRVKGPVVLFCLCLVIAAVSPPYSNRNSLWLFSGSSFSPQQDFLKISKERSEMKGYRIYNTCCHTFF